MGCLGVGHSADTQMVQPLAIFQISHLRAESRIACSEDAQTWPIIRKLKSWRRYSASLSAVPPSPQELTSSSICLRIGRNTFLPLWQKICPSLRPHSCVPLE